MMNLDRRTFASAAAAALALGPGAVFSKERERLRINLIPIADVAPVYAAIQQGFFAQQGLDAVLTPSSGGAAGIPGLIGGAFDVIYGNNVSALLALSRGLDVKIIAPGTEFIPTTAGVLSRKADKLQAGKGLEGKSIAVNTRGNAVWLYAYSWVKETGGDPSKVTFKEVPFPQMVDAVRQGQVDAAFVIEPFYTRALKDPALELLGQPYTIQPHIQVGMYLCAGKTLQEKPEVIRGFLDGLRQANDWYDQRLRSPELVDLIAGYTKLPTEVVAALNRAPAFRSIEVAELNKTMARMQDAGLLSGPVDLAKALHRG